MYEVYELVRLCSFDSLIHQNIQWYSLGSQSSASTQIRSSEQYQHTSVVKCVGVYVEISLFSQQSFDEKMACLQNMHKN